MKKEYSVGNFIYDPKVYDGFNTHQDDIQFYKEWIHKNQINKVLELCCGTGRITIPLAQAGINIIGLDINEDMISEGKLKAKKENVKVEFIKGDMKNIEINEKFQLIFIPFNSIHCLYINDDVIKVLETVSQHLDKNGFLIIDYFNPNIEYIIKNKDKIIKIADYMTADGRHIIINQTMEYDDYSQVNRIKWEHIINGKEKSIDSLDMRMFYPQELDYLLTSNGYKIVN